jgi:hypothetical protein
MSDSRRVYRAIKQAVKQLYPSEPQGNVARHLNTLAGMVTGIVLGKSCQLPTLAGKAPDDSLAESRSKRFSRWLQNETVTAETYFLPFIQALLMNLAQARPLVFIMDGSEVGHGCLALVISVVYGQRALPTPAPPSGACCLGGGARQQRSFPGRHACAPAAGSGGAHALQRDRPVSGRWRV